MTSSQADRRAPYLQIASELRKRILDNTYPAGSYLPSQTVLADDVFKVARMTVRSAIDVLEKEGLLEVMHGKGTLVLDRDGTVATEVYETAGDAILAKLDELQAEITDLSSRVADLEQQSRDQ
jgi:DNA-binding GntR family transcriptional regulator